MPAPQLSLTADDPYAPGSPIVVLGVWKTPDGPRVATNDDRLSPVQDALDSIGVTGRAEELHRIPAPFDGGPALALVGLGSEDDGSAEASVNLLRNAAGAAVRQLFGVEELTIALPVDGPAQVGAVLEGAAVSAYVFHDYRVSSKEGKKTPPSRIRVHAAELPTSAEQLVERATVVADAVHTVRDLVNAPPNDLAPADFAERTVELFAGLPVEVEVLDEERLTADGYGGISGVGQGSSRPPRMVVLRYAPDGAATHLSLVGKGITFDSGGLSLKPAGSMVGMKYDMTGAASVLAVTLAAARLGIGLQITTRLCLAENLPSGTAIRPNDVLRIRGGKTVEVLNTDAEGRLVLADGLAAASEEQPDAIIDVATLTGAATVAMGNRVVPVMGDRTLGDRVVAAGDRSGEPFWPMPLPAELRKLLDSDIADIANAKPGNSSGGMLLGGHFLQAFVGNRPDGSPIPWAHLDIAGAANNGGSAYGVTPKGPTGVAVRTLIALAEEMASA